MDSKIIKNESEFECYGFSIKQLQLENKLITKITLNNCIENFKNKLIEKLTNANASSETIKHLTNYPFDDLCLKIFNSFELQFKEFDDLAEKMLSLSENMIYHFDENMGKYNNSDEESLRNEIREQEIWYMQNKYMLLAMEAELEMYKTLEPLIEKEAELASKLEKPFEKFKEDFGQNDELMETVHNLSHIEII